MTLLLALAACAEPGAEPVAEPPSTVCPLSTSVNDGYDATDLPRLDATFQPVTAVICRAEGQKRADGGTDEVVVERRATDVTALTTALRLPDQPQPEGMFCTRERPFVPWLALLDGQGRLVRPGVPVDGCRKPRAEFDAAVDALSTQPVATAVLTELVSSEAAVAGCTQTDSNMVRSMETMASAATFAPLPSGDAEVKLCLYRVPDDQKGSLKPSGEFESGGRLDATRWATVRAALSDSPPAAACTAQASRFAVLTAERRTIYVEAEGCRRALVDDRTLRATTPELIAAVFG